MLTASHQQTMFDSQMAKAAQAASDQQTVFDTQLAKAAFEASEMKVAYAKPACDNIEERKIAAQVSPAGILSNIYIAGWSFSQIYETYRFTG